MPFADCITAGDAPLDTTHPATRKGFITPFIPARTGSMLLIWPACRQFLRGHINKEV